MLQGVVVDRILRQGNNTMTVVVEIGAELGLACRNLHANRPSHRASFAMSVAATYSASMVII